MNYWLLTGLIVLSVDVLILDLFLPMGVAMGVLYTVPILFSLWFPGRRYTTMATLAGSLFAFIGFFVSPPGGILWIGLLNLGLALFIIWVTTFLVLLRKRAEEQIKTLRGLIPICASCKKIRDDQGYWNILERYVEKHSDAYFTHGLCPDCTKQFSMRASKQSR
ncbi:MAG: hypothetical protein C4293_05645 [Nitrospiraceae bacterium]